VPRARCSPLTKTRTAEFNDSSIQAFRNSSNILTVVGSFPNLSIISATGLSQLGTCSPKSASAVHIWIKMAREPAGAVGWMRGGSAAMSESRRGMRWSSGISFKS
jgi:hypothetical protein